MKAWQRLSAYICLLAMFQNIFLQVAFASGHEDSAFASSNTNLISTTEPVTFSTPDSFATNTSVSDESLEALEMGIISNSNFPPAKSDASTDSPHTSSSSGSPHYLPKQDIGSDYAALDSDEESTQEKSFCRTLTFPDDIPPRQAKLSWQQLDGFPTSLVVSPLHLRWLNGQGELLERKLHRTMGAEGFRQGFEFMVERLFQIGLTGLVMAQLSSANNFTDIFNVFTNGDKHALTALAYNVNQNEKFRRGFIGLATLPLWWGGVKAVRAAWTITKDPQEELKMALADLSSREATSTGFWDDTARWLLPLPPQGRYLNNLMRILRWDGRLDEAERRQGFEAVVNFFNNHGGYSRIASGFALAQLAVSGKKSGQASGRIGEGIGQETYEEIIAINPFEAEVIALIQGMATRSFQQRTPHNLAHQIYGRYLLWWLGRSDYISDSKKESAAFWTFKIGKLAVKALLLQKITEAIQAFLNCPQREGVSFTDAKLGPIKPTRKCFERYQEEFFKLPGQSPKILLDLIPTFNLGTDPIFIDLAGKGIDTENLTAYLQGLLNHYRVGRFPKITGLDISGGSLGASDFVDPTNTINFAKVLRQFTDLEHLNFG